MNLTLKEIKIMNRFNQRVFVSVDDIYSINEECTFLIRKEMFKQEGKYNLNEHGLSFIGNKIEVPKITLPFVKPLVKLNFNKKLLKVLLEALDYTPELKKGEYGFHNELSCVSLCCKEGKLSIFSTDTIRCYMKRGIEVESEDFDIYLNSKCMKNIREDINKYEDVSVVLREDNLVGVEYGNRKMYHKFYNEIITDKVRSKIDKWIDEFEQKKQIKIGMNNLCLKEINEVYRISKTKKDKQRIRFTYISKYNKMFVTSSQKDNKTKKYLYQYVFDVNLECEDFSIILDYNKFKKALSVTSDKSFYIGEEELIKSKHDVRGVKAIFKSKRESFIFLALCTK